jgi:nicotinamidase/pyrazinamidase
MKILLVVDVQKDFCPGGSLAVGEGDCVVPIVNRLMHEGGYDIVFASQDWHPADHGSFAANHPGKKLFEVIDLDGLPQTLWPVHCVQGSPGAEFHPDLDVRRFDAIIQKGQDANVDSYSAFADNGQRRATKLHPLIQTASQAAHVGPEGVEVDVVGLALDYCVKATALDAAKWGHKVSVILDATRAVDARPESVAKIIRELGEHGIQVIESRERLPGREAERGVEVSVARPVDQGLRA